MEVTVDESSAISRMSLDDVSHNGVSHDGAAKRKQSLLGLDAEISPEGEVLLGQSGNSRNSEAGEGIEDDGSPHIDNHDEDPDFYDRDQPVLRDG
jgi:hypothetical protein